LELELESVYCCFRFQVFLFFSYSFCLPRWMSPPGGSMRQSRATLVICVCLVGSIIFLSMRLSEVDAENSALHLNLATGREELRGCQAAHDSLLQTLLDTKTKLVVSHQEVAELEGFRDRLGRFQKDLDDARKLGSGLASELEVKKSAAEAQGTMLKKCEEARESCVSGELSKNDALRDLVDELKSQNERLAAKSQEQQARIQRLKDDCEQTHWKSDAVRESAQSLGTTGKGVVVYVAAKPQLEDLLLSLELLEANFLYCHPYPVHIFAVGDFTDLEIASIREMVPSAPFVNFEPLCLDDCVPRGYSVTVKVLVDWIASSNLSKSLGELSRERFLAGAIFRAASLARFEYMWYLEPNTFISEEVQEDPFLHVEASRCGYGYADNATDHDFSDFSLSEIEGASAIHKLYRKYLSISRGWIKEEVIQRVEEFLSPGLGEYSWLAYHHKLEIFNLGLWRDSKWMTVFDYLDQSKAFYQYDWRASHLRAMALPLLGPQEVVCRLQHTLVSFTSMDPPSEKQIDAAAARPLDRCSKFFGDTEKSIHAAEPDVGAQEDPQQP